MRGYGKREELDAGPPCGDRDNPPTKAVCFYILFDLGYGFYASLPKLHLIYN